MYPNKYLNTKAIRWYRLKEYNTGYNLGALHGERDERGYPYPSVAITINNYCYHTLYIMFNTCSIIVRLSLSHI